MEFRDLIDKLIDMPGVPMKEGAINLLENFINEEYKVAKEEQRYDDIITSVIALSDLGVKDNDLYELLSKYWNIDSRSEATEYINIGRHVEWPYRRLRALLKRSGYDNFRVVKYMKEYNVREKLKNNSNLCELADEKLKSAVEKR